MSLVYFIDGYNLIWSADNFGGGKLQDQRERLLKFLEVARPGGSERNEMWVVFDGQEDVDSPPWRGSVKVIFSKGEDADAVIKRRVGSMANARNAVVVTDDRDIQKWVRASKAKIMSCAEFFRAGARKLGVRKKSTADSRDAVDVEAINEEFRRLWE